MRAGNGDSPGYLVLIHRELKPENPGFMLCPGDEYAYGNLLGVALEPVYLRRRHLS